MPVRVEVVAGPAVPKARRAPVEPPPPTQVEPVVPQPPTRLSAARGPAADKERSPLVATALGDATPRRLWWPVSAGLLLTAVGRALVYQGFTDTIWYVPSRANLGPARGDGFSLAIVLVVAVVLVALVWPRLGMSALGVAAGVALFFVAWSVGFLESRTVSTYPYVAATWRGLAYVGLAGIGVVVLELWHRHLLRAQLWRRPRPLDVGLLVPGAVLLFVATRQDIDGLSAWSKFALLSPVVTLALTCWAILTRNTSEWWEAIFAAAFAYLIVDSFVLPYVALKVHAPFATMTMGGDALLLLALAGSRWESFRLFKRIAPPQDQALPAQ